MNLKAVAAIGLMAVGAAGATVLGVGGTPTDETVTYRTKPGSSPPATRPAWPRPGP